MTGLAGSRVLRPESGLCGPDRIGPRVDVGPSPVVAGAPPESFEQNPPPCGPVLQIDDAGKNAIVTRVKRLVELINLPRLLPDQFADNRVSIAKRPHAEQPQGLARQDAGMPTHEAGRFRRPRAVVHTAAEHDRVISIEI